MKPMNTDTLFIFCPSLSARIDYTFSLLFDWVFPLPYRLTNNLRDWESYSGPRLNYGRSLLTKSSFWIPAGSLLFETGVQTQDIDIEWRAEWPFFFRQDLPEADLLFDLPAMAFYLAVRYEEYLPYEPDLYGRFPASKSLAARYNFLQLPIINFWTQHLVRRLTIKFPDYDPVSPTFRFLPTFDIDMAWAFQRRPWPILAGGTAKALLKRQWQALSLRWQTWLSGRPDPFFSFPLLRSLHPPGEPFSPIFFFLLADYGRFDKNTSPSDPAFHSLIKNLCRDYETGVHLSYLSNDRPEQIPIEIERLSQISGQAVIRNRQHFLKLKLPETYRNLIENGIREDYSMGYAAGLGFRAGLANAFPWYDLPKEEKSALIIYPFQVMDVSLKNYLQYKPEKAWKKVGIILEHTQAVGGQFCTLWHNSSFSELEGWKPWISFYQNLITEIKGLN